MFDGKFEKYLGESKESLLLGKIDRMYKNMDSNIKSLKDILYKHLKGKIGNYEAAGYITFMEAHYEKVRDELEQVESFIEEMNV